MPASCSGGRTMPSRRRGAQRLSWIHPPLQGEHTDLGADPAAHLRLLLGNAGHYHPVGQLVPAWRFSSPGIAPPRPRLPWQDLRVVVWLVPDDCLNACTRAVGAGGARDPERAVYAGGCVPGGIWGKGVAFSPSLKRSRAARSWPRCEPADALLIGLVRSRRASPSTYARRRAPPPPAFFFFAARDDSLRLAGAATITTRSPVLDPCRQADRRRPLIMLSGRPADARRCGYVVTYCSSLRHLPPGRRLARRVLLPAQYRKTSDLPYVLARGAVTTPATRFPYRLSIDFHAADALLLSRVPRLAGVDYTSRICAAASADPFRLTPRGRVFVCGLLRCSSVGRACAASAEPPHYSLELSCGSVAVSTVPGRLPPGTDPWTRVDHRTAPLCSRNARGGVGSNCGCPRRVRCGRRPPLDTEVRLREYRTSPGSGHVESWQVPV